MKMLAGGAELHAQPTRGAFRLRHDRHQEFSSLQGFLELEVEKDVFLRGRGVLRQLRSHRPESMVRGQRSAVLREAVSLGRRVASTSPVIRGDLDKIRPRLMARLQCEGEFKRAA
jgi:hypothetical protein